MLGAEVAAGKAEREDELRGQMHDRALRGASSPELTAPTGPSRHHPDQHPPQHPEQHPEQHQQED